MVQVERQPRGLSESQALLRPFRGFWSAFVCFGGLLSHVNNDTRKRITGNSAKLVPQGGNLYLNDHQCTMKKHGLTDKLFMVVQYLIMTRYDKSSIPPAFKGRIVSS
jgi:hypothetical protein